MNVEFENEMSHKIIDCDYNFGVLSPRPIHTSHPTCAPRPTTFDIKDNDTRLRENFVFECDKNNIVSNTSNTFNENFYYNAYCYQLSYTAPTHDPRIFSLYLCGLEPLSDGNDIRLAGNIDILKRKCLVCDENNDGNQIYNDMIDFLVVLLEVVNLVHEDLIQDDHSLWTRQVIIGVVQLEPEKEQEQIRMYIFDCLYFSLQVKNVLYFHVSCVCVCFDDSCQVDIKHGPVGAGQGTIGIGIGLEIGLVTVAVAVVFAHSLAAITKNMFKDVPTQAVLQLFLLFFFCFFRCY